MPTNSGFRRLVHGTRERILSSDHNREQSFEAAMLADAFRYLFDAGTEAEQAAGVASLGSTLTNPMRAVIFNGLRVRPEIGTFNLFVDAGVGLFVDPGSPASTDDSVAQVVRSAGQNVAGALVISTPGGGNRIDVIECSISQVVIEADNRDVFNPSTGTFTPQLINKVVEAQLTWRVRAGTPGAGFPGTAAGWLPLAVARVPTAAATNDDCDFWDVRPLLSDMAHGTHLVRQPFPGFTRQHAYAVDDGAGWKVTGIVETEYVGRKVGGNLAPSASGATYLDVSLAANQEPLFAAVGSRPWYLYLAFPGGLPRWSKYSPASSGARNPLSPRGIPIFSQRAPSGLQATPSAPLVLPSATSLGGTTSDAVVVLSGAFDSVPNFAGCVRGENGTQLVGPAIAIAPTSGANTNAPGYNLPDNTTHPAYAKRLKLRFTTTIAAAAGTVSALTRSVTFFDGPPASNAIGSWQLSATVTQPVAGSFVDRFEVDCEVPPNLPTGAPRTLYVAVAYTNIGTFSSQSCAVLGWS